MTAFHIHRQHTKKRSKLWLLLLSPFVIVAVAIVVSVGWYKSSLQPVSDSKEEVIVTVQVGATAPQIGDILDDKGLIQSSLSFDIYTRINNYRDKLQAGGYKFSPSQSVEQIVNQLVTGAVATDLFTILPAQRIDQVRAAFVSAGYSVDEVDKALNPSNYAGHPALVGKPENANLEGYLYPDSYQKTNTTTVEQIIEASLDEMADALTPELLASYQEAGLSPFEAITIASIVEREVNNTDDRLIVAQVFLKRYREGMMLGSDPTALYGALLAGIEPSVFADTPYNTRLYTGLPPGPINNISSMSLQAVANPGDTDYLFFVSGDDGKTYFSNTLAEHEALTAQHCIELCKSY
jgi:UPF0755 protein